ncbi:hypothetical protein ACC806_17305, partial [Rhizobium ruizarguesonis]
LRFILWSSQMGQSLLQNGLFQRGKVRNQEISQPECVVKSVGFRFFVWIILSVEANDTDDESEEYYIPISFIIEIVHDCPSIFSIHILLVRIEAYRRPYLNCSVWRYCFLSLVCQATRA